MRVIPSTLVPNGIAKYVLKVWRGGEYSKEDLEPANYINLRILRC